MVNIAHKGKIAAIISSIVAFDQIVKHLVVNNISLGKEITVLEPLLSWTYIQNTGAGFGLFSGMNTILAFLGIMISAGLTYYYFTRENIDTAPYVLIVAGAIGNVIDRITRGFVVDFISLPHWPAFNIADSAITIGVIWMIVSSLKKEE